MGEVTSTGGVLVERRAGGPYLFTSERARSFQRQQRWALFEPAYASDRGFVRV